MASTRPTGTQVVGTTALPITLGATGSATDVGTWTHNFGVNAVRVIPLLSASRAPATPASIVVTQPTVNTMVVTNTTAGALSVVLEVVWAYDSTQLQAPVAASAVVLS